MTSKSFPACIECKHYDTDSELYHRCKLHYTEYPDYAHGIVHKESRLCSDARKNESLCGPTGHNFEPNDNPRKEISFSLWNEFKQMIKSLFF